MSEIEFDPTRHGYDSSTLISDFNSHEAYAMGVADALATHPASPAPSEAEALAEAWDEGRVAVGVGEYRLNPLDAGNPLWVIGEPANPYRPTATSTRAESENDWRDPRPFTCKLHGRTDIGDSEIPMLHLHEYHPRTREQYEAEQPHPVRVEVDAREKIAKALFDVRDDEFDMAEWDEIDSTDRERYYCDADVILARFTVTEKATT